MLSLIPMGIVLMEGFHACAHLNVLLRISPPHLSTLSTRGWYFGIDGLCHLLPYFIHGRFLPYLLLGV